jgi:hypothetical protein
MQKTTTIDHGVLEMALVGYQLQRKEIDAAISEILAELGQGDARRSPATTEPATLRRKRFSSASRKRMAAAQKKRWAKLKEKKARAKKTLPTAPANRRKATGAVSVKKTALKPRKAALKPQAKASATKQKNSPAVVPNPKSETLITPVEVATEPAPPTL